jgi:hypothetical protein
MNIITHALVGWCFGRQISEKPKDALLLFAASVAPDIDGIGALVDIFNGGEAVWFSSLHHKFGHNIFFCLALMPIIWHFSRSARLTIWSAVIFHFHLFCDIIGARGPDGYQWPIYYLYPLSDYEIVWSGQWQINSWPNIQFTIFLLILFLFQSARTGFSPIGFISLRADRAFVDTLRRRFGFEKQIDRI